MVLGGVGCGDGGPQDYNTRPWPLVQFCLWIGDSLVMGLGNWELDLSLKIIQPNVCCLTLQASF